MTPKSKTLKSVIKNTSIVCKMKSPNLKKLFSKKTLKFNNLSSKKLLSDKCSIPKPTDTNRKLKLFNKDLNKMNSTLMTSTPKFNKKLQKNNNILTILTNCWKTKLLISKVKETLWSSWLNKRKSNSKVKDLHGEQVNKIIKRLLPIIKPKTKSLNKTH